MVGHTHCKLFLKRGNIFPWNGYRDYLHGDLRKLFLCNFVKCCCWQRFHTSTIFLLCVSVFYSLKGICDCIIHHFIHTFFQWIVGWLNWIFVVQCPYLHKLHQTISFKRKQNEWTVAVLKRAGCKTIKICMVRASLITAVQLFGIPRCTIL